MNWIKLVLVFARVNALFIRITDLDFFKRGFRLVIGKGLQAGYIGLVIFGSTLSWGWIRSIRVLLGSRG